MSDKERSVPIDTQPHELRNLFYLTYRFTQGQPTAFEKLITWIYANGYISQDQISLEPPKEILEITPPRAHEQEYESDNIARWNDLVNISRFTYTPDNIFTTEVDILEKMIARDLHYQSKERPNRREEGNSIPDSINDPHASMVRRFILMKQDPLHQAYVKLFHERLHPLLEGRLRSLEHPIPWFDPSMRQLRQLQTLWEVNHPGQKFSPTDITA